MKIDRKKSFFIPIVVLVVLSVIIISFANAYLNIYAFKKQVNNNILILKKTYLKGHQQNIKSQVDSVLKDINFEINKVEDFAKERLNERIQTAIKMVTFIS